MIPIHKVGTEVDSGPSSAYTRNYLFIAILLPSTSQNMNTINNKRINVLVYNGGGDKSTRALHSLKVHLGSGFAVQPVHPIINHYFHSAYDVLTGASKSNCWRTMGRYYCSSRRWRIWPLFQHWKSPRGRLDEDKKICGKRRYFLPPPPSPTPFPLPYPLLFPFTSALTSHFLSSPIFMIS